MASFGALPDLDDPGWAPSAPPHASGAVADPGWGPSALSPASADSDLALSPAPARSPRISSPRQATSPHRAPAGPGPPLPPLPPLPALSEGAMALLGDLPSPSTSLSGFGAAPPSPLVVTVRHSTTADIPALRPPSPAAKAAAAAQAAAARLLPEELAEPEPEPLDAAAFAEAVRTSNKNFHAVARAVGCTRARAVQHYYDVFKRSPAYAEWKRADEPAEDRWRPPPVDTSTAFFAAPAKTRSPLLHLLHLRSPKRLRVS